MNRIVKDGTFASIGLASFITENAIPVENAANAPHAIPKPGMNIGRARVVLCENIPIASISPISDSNCSRIIALSSSQTRTSAPIANAAEKIPRKTKNKTIRLSIYQTKIIRTLECFQERLTVWRQKKKLSSWYYRVYSWALILEFAPRYPQHAW